VSRAEPADGLPPPPTLRGALRAAASDLYYHSIRVVPVNVLFAAIVLLGIATWAAWGPFAAAVPATLLAVPLAGLARLAANATRGADVNLSDALDPMRRRPAAVLLGGLGFTLAMLVLSVNVVTGLTAGNVVAFAIGTMAFWGIVATLALGFAFWPLLADPQREDRPSSEALRVAALLLVAHPLRIGALTIVLVATLLASMIAFAAIVTVSVGFVMLVAARYVLPASDRLEAAIGRTPPSRPPAG